MPELCGAKICPRGGGRESPPLEFGVVLSLNSTNQLAYLNVLAGGINAFSFYDKLRVVGSKFNDKK